jgi:predicted RNA methylase
MIQTSLATVELVPELSQYFTPEWLAVKTAGVVSKHFWGDRCRILEPHCGAGALVRQLVRHGFTPQDIVANDIDPRLTKLVAAEFPKVSVTTGPAQNIAFERDSFDLVVMNSPYENGQDIEALELGLFFSPVVYAIVRSELEQFVEMHRKVLSKASITWQALCVGRPAFECSGGNGGGGRFETMVIRLDRGVTHVGTSKVNKEYWFKVDK